MKTALYTLLGSALFATGYAAFLTYSAVHNVGHAVAVGFKIFS